MVVKSSKSGPTPTSEEEGETKDARRYFKEGQKHVTPPKGDSTRGFYESLLEEKPDSVMATRYCVEYGIFAGEKHRKLLAQYNDLKASGDLNPNKRALDRVAEKFGIASEESSAPSAKRRKTTKDEKSKKKSSSSKVKKEKKSKSK
ncbi:High mobility group protein B1, putative [Perkinsus marinus ATCC 50983]|uniref:High mobility group protein B1, putative n=1 Tax=Perkinsus marinus (strain ATCC 50983 / TXsc) TaxID=423536 RepID=C5KUP5_PERM5|nr:High mobility group protein B1, putative [Perkinsus marinus ATCC 50983]EER11766.1 High mobility group protein B1, putative [Perkinsus marinus ATCC 50983]|eukprot:XP_002779971.1 High mobility group protein B1, putative [Perkinsus marinus ATCC 50983]